MTDFTPHTKACFVGIDFGGVTHYRLMLPARALKASLFVRTREMDREKLVGNRDAAVSIYSMPRSVEMIDECQQILALPHRRLIIDIDDCLRAVIQDSRHGASDQWKDLLPKHEWLISRADAVTCTNGFLEDYARSLGQENVHVIPNALDLERWNIKREPRHKKFTIVGWSGSYGHEGAWEAHAPAMVDLLERRDDIALGCVGVPISPHFPKELRHRIHEVPFQPMSRHPHVLTQFHINIGPCEDTDFYRAKSDLRALEAIASDSAFIGTDVTYGQVPHITYSGEPEEMVEGIERLVDDSRLNWHLRKQSMKWLKENRLIEHTAPLWEAAIQSVMP